MASVRPLVRLGIGSIVPGPVLETLQSANISTSRDMLESCPLFLMRLTGLSKAEVDGILLAVAEKVCPKPVTALSLLNGDAEPERLGRSISTGFEELDAVLKGGLMSGTVADICGVPASGKRQFCLGICIQAALKSYMQSRSLDEQEQNEGTVNVIYFKTGGEFPIKRLQQMMAAHIENFKVDRQQRKPTVDELSDMIRILQPTSLEELSNALEDEQSTVISNNVDLIVIDSIIPLARAKRMSEEDTTQYALKQASLLKRLGEASGCMSIFINQVQELKEEEDVSLGANELKQVGISVNTASESVSTHSALLRYRSNLGIQWHHYVDTRIVLGPALPSFNQKGEEIHRKMMLIEKSPISPHALLFYKIGRSGIEMERDLVENE